MSGLENIKKDFPIFNNDIYDSQLIYLDSAATTQKPQIVIDSLVDFYQNHYSNIHRGAYYLSEKASSLYEYSRETVQKFINARNSYEIIFTKSTTESINLLAASFGDKYLHENDEIIVTEMEHHSNLIPWQIVCQKKKAILKTIPIDQNGELQLNLLENMINKKTKLICFTHASNALGTLNPVKKIIKIAKKYQVKTLIDSAQTVAHLPIDVQDLDCDFLVFSGHKMYGGTGIGVLYGRLELLNQLPPYQTGGGMVDKVTTRQATFLDPPLRFEAGTPDFVGAYSLATAINYLNKIELDSIFTHEQQLLSYAKEKLEAVPGLTIYGNPSQRCSTLSFNIEGIHHYDLGVLLDKLAIAVRTGNHCCQPVMQHFGITGTVRISFGIYNNQADIDKLIDGISRAQNILSVQLTTSGKQ